MLILILEVFTYKARIIKEVVVTQKVLHCLIFVHTYIYIYKYTNINNYIFISIYTYIYIYL